ncbi:TetR/AcrR family transcriptional regulator [Micromonospora sp. STR1s_5]|nr:TetR/AcrR family transcriptional regulator [Micromonospora sp. STR1s_5]
MSRMQRADARFNRDRVVAAAREAFASAGLEVPMREVARRAGVGVATLYRHFPTRTELVATVLAERVDDCGVRMRRASTTRTRGGRCPAWCASSPSGRSMTGRSTRRCWGRARWVPRSSRSGGTTRRR